MKIYKSYCARGFNETFTFYPVSLEDCAACEEIEVNLPAGAKEITTMSESRAVELENGCICPDILTYRKGGSAKPYIVDTAGNNPKKLYLEIVK